MVGVAKVETIDLKKMHADTASPFCRVMGQTHRRIKNRFRSFFFLQNYALEKGTLAEK